mmetsp:Transcript_19442/g.61144  ORF Transcript_19442/g.61144 Transcript_19442/m.61144 type:complete len:222 (+) Transcript_19442:701-1366(+)
MQRPRSSTSWSMSRSSFSKDRRSRKYQDPSRTSGAVRLNSARPSPAGCVDQEREIKPAVPSVADMSLSTSFSGFGLSPSQTTREPGLALLPTSSVTGSGPSGLDAATLLSVKSRASHSVFSLSRSSSSFFFIDSPPAGAIPLAPDLRPSSSPALASSSCNVGNMSTTCALSEASAARPKASLIASSPTLYRTVSSVNLFARTSLVMFSMMAIIFLTFVERA